MDVTLSQKFISCVTGNEVPYEIWDAPEPNNSGGIEACVALNLNAGMGLFDVPCEFTFLQRPFICEVRYGPI